MEDVMIRFALTLCTGLALVSSSAFGMTCSPLDNTARILASPTPNDIHPDWSGDSHIGTSWSFSPMGRIEDGTGTYLKGNLYSPRGGLVNPLVYIIAREWRCE
jgi:hypothetical protein